MYTISVAAARQVLWAFMAMGVGAAAIGCTLVDPRSTCEEQARTYGSDFVVVGVFSTTVGRIRMLTPGVDPPRWPELAAESQAVVCYLDGPVAKAPLAPGRPFDRAVIGRAGSHAEMIMAGYRESLRIQPP